MSEIAEAKTELEKRLAEGEQDGDGVWLAFQYCAELGIAKPFWIHTTRNADFVRRKTKTGKWTYLSGELRGEDGETRVVYFVILGKGFVRHRAMALATGLMTLEQYRDETLVVKHKARREENEYPDDRPENLEVGTQKENMNDPGNKKRVPSALGKPVSLLRKIRTESGHDIVCERLTFPSIKATADFLGIHPGFLRDYMNGDENNMPMVVRAEWDAVWATDASFSCTDAVRIRGTKDDDDRRMSPTTTPSPLLRLVGDNTYVFSRNKPKSNGYIYITICGTTTALHRFVFMLFKRAEFDAKLAMMPPGTKERCIQIDHIDGDKLNNSLSNLEALTPMEHARKHSLAIDWVDDGWVLETFECSVDAARAVRGKRGQSLDEAAIRRVCDSGNRTHTGGRFFEYTDPAAAAARKTVKAAAKRKRSEFRAAKA